jgi:DNA polymerase-1
VEAGGTALVLTSDRDAYQLVREGVTILAPQTGGKPPARIGAAEVVERYGVTPAQVPDFIALRGDPSDSLPGAKGIGEKTARDLLREHGDLEALLADARRATTELRPRQAQALRDQADELRLFRHIATLVPVDVERPADAPTDFAAGAAAARERGMNALARRLEGLGAD